MKKAIACVGLALIIGIVIAWMSRDNREVSKAEATPETKPIAVERVISASHETGRTEPVASDVEAITPAEEQSEEDRKAELEEKLVDAFDNLTDKWMEPSFAGVSMQDVEEFVKTFKQVPKERQEECIQRALNLVPDENVLLLAGVLMDRSIDKEIAETVFNDVLNRDEDVKKPIMQQIFKDKTHPCWADVAWILDVTGELPNRNQQ